MADSVNYIRWIVPHMLPLSVS